VAVFTLQRLVAWIAIVFCGFFLSFVLLHNIAIAIALAGLVAAVSGTILYGEERMPFVVGGLVLLLIAGVTDFEHIVENMEWVLFIKLVGLLTWVDFLNRSGYFDKLIERFMPRNLTGFKLLALLFILASLSAALIDEVNSIVLWYAVGRALIGFDKLGRFKLKKAHWATFVILLVSVTNIGSQFLPLGNPVGIAVSVLSGLTPLDFILYTWVPGFLTLGYFLWRISKTHKKLVTAFLKVKVEKSDFRTLEKSEEKYEMVEHIESIDSKKDQLVHDATPPKRILDILFGSGLLGLILVSPIAGIFGISQTASLGAFILLLFASTLYIASKHGHHTEVSLSELPWNTLFFILFLFGIAHMLEETGFTAIVASSILAVTGSNQILIRAFIVLVGGITTALMDNVIAIAVLAPILVSLGTQGIETTGLWFTLLITAVVAGNLTPIGSAANIIANAKIRASWVQWWKTAGVLALECLAINVVLAYLWELVIRAI
jgi:Na+/H+ antiporter NhaD/arsenite permease-like protein